MMRTHYQRIHEYSSLNINICELQITTLLTAIKFYKAPTLNFTTPLHNTEHASSDSLWAIPNFQTILSLLYDIWLAARPVATAGEKQKMIKVRNGI